MLSIVILQIVILNLKLCHKLLFLLLMLLELCINFILVKSCFVAEQNKKKNQAGRENGSGATKYPVIIRV